MKVSESKLVQFNCPGELLQELDRLIVGKYRDRTEALLDAVRKLLKELKEA